MVAKSLGSADRGKLVRSRAWVVTQFEIGPRQLAESAPVDEPDAVQREGGGFYPMRSGKMR